MADIGRPTVMTEEVLRKMEEAFSYGATDKEAIFQANISSTAFYEYCKEHPEFTERKEALKDTPKYQARRNIAKAITEGDKQLSQWYAERKIKDEFSQKTETDITSKGESVNLDPKTVALAKEYEEKLKKGL